MNVFLEVRDNIEFRDEYKNLIKKVIKESLEYENFTLDCEISVTIVEDYEIRQINKEFRDIDNPTDVLSFPIINFETEKIDYSHTVILGDIVININRVISQAKEYGHSFERELGFLTAHSMLHLLGYDHMVSDEEKIMFQKQEEILNKLNLMR